jgi:UDP-glucose 4-epimerase
VQPTVLITGVNGFIGSHVVRRLLEDGYAVLGASIEPTCALNIPYQQVDIANREDVTRLFAENQIACVVHLAALVHNKSKDLSYETYERVNYTGAKNIFECAAQHGCTRLLFASTIEVYGEPVGEVVLTDAPRDPKTFYAITKKMAEDCLLAMGPGMQSTIMRFAPVYARDFTLNLDKRIFAVKGNKWAYYLKDGSYSFHFCSINNILDFISFWLGQPKLSGVFHIADTSTVTAKELIRLAKTADPTIHVLHLPYSLAYAAIWCAEKLLRIVGKKDSMLSVYNFKKLFHSTRWDVSALKSAMPKARNWNVENTLYK